MDPTLSKQLAELIAAIQNGAPGVAQTLTREYVMRNTVASVLLWALTAALLITGTWAVRKIKAFTPKHIYDDPVGQVIVATSGFLFGATACGFAIDATINAVSPTIGLLRMIR